MKEKVETIFKEAQRDMRNYYTTLPEDSFNFEEFHLQYDNSIKSLILFVKNLNEKYSELNRWNDFNLTMFKQLISKADQFSKNKSKSFKFWDSIPILISMRM